jgi:hypothetical protein
LLDSNDLMEMMVILKSATNETSLLMFDVQVNFFWNHFAFVHRRNNSKQTINIQSVYLKFNFKLYMLKSFKDSPIVIDPPKFQKSVNEGINPNIYP